MQWEFWLLNQQEVIDIEGNSGKINNPDFRMLWAFPDIPWSSSTIFLNSFYICCQWHKYYVQIFHYFSEILLFNSDINTSNY